MAVAIHDSRITALVGRGQGGVITGINGRAIIEQSMGGSGSAIVRQRTEFWVGAGDDSSGEAAVELDEIVVAGIRGVGAIDRGGDIIESAVGRSRSEEHTS